MKYIIYVTNSMLSTLPLDGVPDANHIISFKHKHLEYLQLKDSELGTWSQIGLN